MSRARPEPVEQPIRGQVPVSDWTDCAGAEEADRRHNDRRYTRTVGREAVRVGDFTDLSDAPVTKRWPQMPVSAYSAALNDESRFGEIPTILRIVTLTPLVASADGVCGTLRPASLVPWPNHLLLP